MTKKGEGILDISKELLLDRNVRVIAVTGIISGIYIGMLNAILQQFTVGAGISLVGLGILSALGGRFSGLLPSVVQPFSGHYADVFGRKKVIVAGSLITIVSMLLFFMSALSKNWLVLSVAYVLFGVAVLGSPASQAVIAESANMDPDRMNIAYSVVFLLSTIPSAAMAVLGGAVADLEGYSIIFVIAMALEVIDLSLYLRKLRETRPRLTPGQPSDSEPKFSLSRVLSLPKGFLGLFASFAMDSFSFSISSSIVYAIIVEHFGFTNADVGLIVGVWYLSMILAQYPATRLLLRFGMKKTLALSEFFGVVLMLGWYFSSTVSLFVVFSVVFGISVATWVPAQQTILMKHSPPDERGSLGGKLAAFRGIMAFPGPIIGGALYQAYGYHSVMLAALVGTILTTIMIVRFLPGEDENLGRPGRPGPEASASISNSQPCSHCFVRFPEAKLLGNEKKAPSRQR
jgi:DHA1 family multidrug resistance protein-like MFS transporter